MTDKELFEKVEKEFLPERSLKLERFKKTNFQKVLNEVRGPRAPGANVGGFLSRAAAAIPGTRGYRMRSAEARKQEALARQEELKAQQAEKDLKYGVKGDTPTDPVRKQRYENDARYKRVWDAYKQGKERDVSASDIDYYNQIEANIEKGTIDKAAEEKIRNKAITDIDDLIKQKAPKTEKALLGQKGQKDNFIKFMLGDELSQDVLKALALTITSTTQHDKKELAGIKDVINKNGKASDGDKASFIDYLPKIATRKKVADEDLKQDLKNMSKQEGIPIKDLLIKLNKEADKFKTGIIVVGPAGGLHKVTGKDGKTGTVVVRSQTKQPKTTKKFARDLKIYQKEFKLDSNEESFEQIVKRYR